MLPFDAERVRANVQKASTEDLLDRATVYRAGMEPEALEIIEVELHARGIKGAAIRDHAAQRAQTAISHPDGTVVACSFCARPAVEQRWGWSRLWGVLPILPHYLAYCAEHAKAAEAGERFKSVFPRYFAYSEDQPTAPR